MKFLLTGMTSAHTSKSVHANNLGFFGNLETALLDTFPDATVVWAQPSVLWEAKDLKEYDQVFVGVIPPTAISANHIYGALKVINLLRGSDKLTLALDHNELWQYRTAFASIVKNPDYLLSNFYSKRKDYSQAGKFINQLADAAKHLDTENWGKVIYPALPWSNDLRTAYYSRMDITNITGLSLDIYSLEKYEVPESLAYRSEVWGLTVNNKWAKALDKSQRFPSLLLKRSKTVTDSHIFEAMTECVGVIIPPSDRNAGTWWSHRYIQSLLAGAPIATEWRDSAMLGDSWTVLPYQIEDMPDKARIELALEQKKSYLAAISSKEAIRMTIKSLYGKMK